MQIKTMSSPSPIHIAALKNPNFKRFYGTSISLFKNPPQPPPPSVLLASSHRSAPIFSISTSKNHYRYNSFVTSCIGTTSAGQEVIDEESAEATANGGDGDGLASRSASSDQEIENVKKVVKSRREELAS